MLDIEQLILDRDVLRARAREVKTQLRELCRKSLALSDKAIAKRLQIDPKEVRCRARWIATERRRIKS